AGALQADNKATITAAAILARFICIPSSIKVDEASGRQSSGGADASISSRLSRPAIYTTWRRARPCH
ncbi:hypothetical protein, partial [Pseudomonas sp. CGJS7]|uniref:hypothetical protein n=1 Tax=Pseudomonas sp. CGJS7 TaxID=3109348 RepID=UPI003008894B